MATSNDTTQRPRLQFSQSFRTQLTQDAVADVAPLARSPAGEQGSHDSQTTVAEIPTTNGIQRSTTKAHPLNEERLHHRVNASGSVQAIVVDVDVLFAGLQGGDIVVCYPQCFSQVPWSYKP